MSLSLYNLTGQWLAMRDQLADAGFDEQTIADTLDAESTPYDEKVARVAMVIDEFEAMAEQKKALAKKFSAEGSLLESRAASLRRYLSNSLSATGRTDVRHELIQVKLYIGRDESVEIKSEDDIPLQYMKTETKVSPDKTAIKAALKAGEIIVGAELLKKDRLTIKH
ncbi:siphovirus Gp157 family protein [Burkholderia contaminans]|uniref:siphovirus Gp157 family protein n=1 Tax=Burkholderia TaxID=32008 RepID=UPI0010F46EB7|nr:MULTISPECIES: siphovirus Gp157 family protein [Burkholderia]MBD1412901.1 siphovirus Gp157 family protein [Burkholderia contaminans]UXZ68650.1 siphovirus Gp157 family protein [Burkholderia contaminans]UXZ76411.1 siphovirus Gp157 family protein [Burkholderia contaminans]